MGSQYQHDEASRLSERMEKETLQEVRGLRGEVAEINRSQADLKTDQVAMIRDIHHMNLQMVDQAASIKEMAQAIVKLAAVSEKMDNANKDINQLGEMTRGIKEEQLKMMERANADKQELSEKIHALETEVTGTKGDIKSHDKTIAAGRWLLGSIFLLMVAAGIAIFTGT